MARPTLDCELVTALITPFQSDLSVDHAALERLVRHLVDTGSDGILIHGSTGESPTVSLEEKRDIFKAVRNVLNDSPHVKLIVGCGSNDTRASVESGREWAALNPDALLVVVPYYNKPSQKGLLAHFGAIADAVDAPLMIYNIPGRSVVNMLPETAVELATRHERIVGIKQSNPDLDQASEIRRLAPEGFQLWAGDDSLTLPMLAIGAQGVVSVASHVVGRLLRELITAFKRGDVAQARQLHLAGLPVFRELFFLPNPTVVKACLSHSGMVGPYMRLPLVGPDDAETERIEVLMHLLESLGPPVATA